MRFPRFLADEEEEDALSDQPAEPEADADATAEPAPLHWAWTLALAAAAAVPRLVYLFLLTDPENPGERRYGDVWHHWQIAYLTKEIGLGAPDGPRLWDLKGLDYFWGILHPLLMVAIFYVTGSIDIVLDRIVSIVFGLVVVILLFHICRRYWGSQVALGAALVAITLPTSVMNDASGMLEPLGVALCLLGIWGWQQRRGFWSGLAFGLATMARAEAWIFGAGMVIAAFFRRQGWQQRLPLVAGFGLVMIAYMKVLADKTGNPIYPLWWNFLANAVGKWEIVPISADQASVRPVLGVALLAAVGGLAWTLWKRPPSYMLLTFGFGYWVFVAGMLGFTSYLASWVWWMPITRVFAFPYVFVGVLVAVVLLWWLPRRGTAGRRAGWVALIGSLVAAQLLWIPIWQEFSPSEAEWKIAVAESEQLGTWYHQPGYDGHALAVPDDRPDLTYALARFGDVEGKHLVSEMYGPFAYLPAGYVYADHEQTVNTLLECWLHQTDTHLIAVPRGDPDYTLMVQLNPGWFTYLGTLDNAGWAVEGVNAPAPPAAECRAAQAAAR